MHCARRGLQRQPRKHHAMHQTAWWHLQRQEIMQQVMQCVWNCSARINDELAHAGM